MSKSVFLPKRISLPAALLNAVLLLIAAGLIIAPAVTDADDGATSEPTIQATTQATTQTSPDDQPAFSVIAHHVPPVPDRDIEQAIQRGVEFIYSKQNKAGNWEARQKPGPWVPQTGYEIKNLTNDVQFGGTTGLCVYALLSAGESPDDPRLARAIQFLKTTPMHGIYAVSMRLNAFSLLSSLSTKQIMKQDEAMLLRTLVTRDNGPMGNKTKASNPDSGVGMYCYSDRLVPGRPDHSVSQFAVLGVWMAQQAGFDAGDEYWHTIENAWLRDQTADGGWTYVGKTPPETGSMTAAGLATLFIAEDELHSMVGLNCKGNAINPAIARGFKWIESHFVTDHNPGMLQTPFYYLFAVQRVGVASGYRYFGKHDWFNEGARQLLSMQTEDGSWPLEEWLTTVNTTAFAVLFLSRGNHPQLINKLEYDGRWAQRPRDAANLARWFGATYEREFSWQIVNIDGDTEDFHNAPLLYIAGHGALKFTDEQRAKLRQYVQGGGILLGNADCADSAFADSFQQLMRDLFPQYPLRELPADDLIFSYNKLKQTPQIIAQSNGVRELALLVPKADLGRDFQLNHPNISPEAFNIGGDIGLYASDPATLQRRNHPYFVFRDAAITAQSPGYREVKMARIQYDGNWNPEPGGWQRISNILHNQYALDLSIHSVKLGDGTLADYRVAHLTGTQAINFNDAQSQDLKIFLRRGGTLIVDAAGGSEAFATSIEKYLNNLVSPIALSPISINDRIFAAPTATRLDEPPPKAKPKVKSASTTQAATQPATAPAAYGEPDLTRGPLRFAYRRFARTRFGRDESFRLSGIKFGSRWMVIYSPVDLSAGLVGQNVDGIVGYSPASATEMVRRILVSLYGP